MCKILLLPISTLSRSYNKILESYALFVKVHNEDWYEKYIKVCGDSEQLGYIHLLEFVTVLRF
jgi:hypothetical protein